MNTLRARGATASTRLGEGGFTLVEAVVALAILSLLMTTVLAALRAFGNTQNSLEAVVQRSDAVRAVSSFLREGLEASVVGTDGGGGLGFGGSVESGSRELAYFRGNEAGFEWKARMVFGESYGGTFLVRVARQEGQLVLHWQRPPRFGDEVSWDDQLSRVLVDQLQEFELAYRGEPGTAWMTSWHEKQSPELVRLSLKANDRHWPELVMVVQR